MSAKTKVDIGFVDECEDWKLHSRFFPSKVGGQPAWLDLQNLPKPSEMICGKCGEPCVFLCQIYAPIEDDPDAFHRTIFVFICPNGSCCEPNNYLNLHVFRCQLKRSNDFYSYDPPQEEEIDDKPIMPSLCAVCGAKGPSHCAKCKTTKYCSRSHQVFHWKNGHKETCGSDSKPLTDVKRLLFQQWELIIDEECEDEKGGKSTEEEEMEKYKKLVEEQKTGSLNSESEQELEQYANKATGDKVFEKFKKRTEREPGQVLRYDRGGIPLWITSKNSLKDSDIPNCQFCASKRQFEFQIMPQLLNFLKLDLSVNSIDWGILAVYTCESSCSGSSEAYKKEFIYKQDIVVENS